MKKFDIHARRKELNLTLEDIGKYVGVGKSTVKKWETGYIKNMRRDKIHLLAEILQVTPLIIMGYEEEASAMQQTNEEMADLYFQMRKNEKLAEVIKILCKLPPERLDAVLLFLQAFEQ